MIRELSEEVGIKKNYEILMELEGWLSYSLPSSLKKIVWNGKYVGQVQKWFACRFFGQDYEFDLETYKPEFEDWKWIKPEDVMDFVVPFKKKLYRDDLEAETIKQFSKLTSLGSKKLWPNAIPPSMGIVESFAPFI